MLALGWRQQANGHIALHLVVVLGVLTHDAPMEIIACCPRDTQRSPLRSHAFSPKAAIGRPISSPASSTVPLGPIQVTRPTSGMTSPISHFIASVRVFTGSRLCWSSGGCCCAGVLPAQLVVGRKASMWGSNGRPDVVRVSWQSCPHRRMYLFCKVPNVARRVACFCRGGEET